MKHAKVLTVAERKRLRVVMLSFLAGLRVGEVASLKLGDVVDGEGRARYFSV